MILLSYVLGSILIAMVVGFLLPRTAIIVGCIFLLLGVLSVSACIYQEFIITRPHDTSSYGMLATISCLTIVPLGIAMIVIGFMRR